MKIFVFDLDGTTVDSSHRVKHLPNGEVDLDHWYANSTAEQLAKDTLLPVYDFWKSAREVGHMVVICTARILRDCDHAFFEANGLVADLILGGLHGGKETPGQRKKRQIKGLAKQHANAHITFFDDNPDVLREVSTLKGVLVVDAKMYNYTG